jgi:hypothetical protein
VIGQDKYTYCKLMEALGYPEEQQGVATYDEVLEDALHMIELGHRYLDLME